MAVMTMERAFGRREKGTGGLGRNKYGWYWQIMRKGVSYRGATVSSRQEADDGREAACTALDRGDKPDVAPKQSTDGRVRSKTIPPAALLRQVKTARNNEWNDIEYPTDVDRPLTRGDCANMPRPCPFVSCAHHLFLDVDPKSGSIKFNRPDLEVWELRDSCSLDGADRGGVTLEEVGAMTNLTRERIRQYEVRAHTKIKNADNGDLSRPSSPETYPGHQGPHSGAP